MNDLDRIIRARVEAFVQEISELVRNAALDAVTDALGGSSKAIRPPKAKSSGQRAHAGRSKGAKRSSAEMDRLTASILAHIAANPGTGAREIAAELGLSTKDVALPVKKLVAAGALTTKGQKRATKYFRGKR